VNRTRAHNERGDATVEAVLVTPVLLFLIMVVIQFGLWYHASHVAEAAAQEGASAARVEAATADDGRVSAQQFMRSAAPALVGAVSVTASRDAEVARVEVDGTMHSLIPGLTFHVHGEAQSPVERFRPEPP
jgi:Flp pilus assembly protein TadG